MRRREFSQWHGHRAVARRAGRKSEKMRRIGVLLPAGADISEFQAFVGDVGA
jgi:hypothetical protein